jgi:hypothetical protein
VEIIQGSLAGGVMIDEITLVYDFAREDVLAAWLTLPKRSLEKG